MKRLLLSLAVAAALAMPQTAEAKKSVTAAQTQQVDTTAIVAYSDTTDTADIDTAMMVAPNLPMSVNINTGNLDDFFSTAVKATDGLLSAVMLMLLLFIGLPVACLILVGYLVYRHYHQKLKLEEMALRGGQPMPQAKKKTPEEQRRDGIRNVAIGLGLAAFFYCVFGTGILMGIGLFLAIYGGGQIAMAKTSANRL